MMGLRRVYAFVSAMVLAAAIGAGPVMAQTPETTLVEAGVPSTAPAPVDPAAQVLEQAVQTAKDNIASGPATLAEPPRPGVIRAAASRGSQITYMGERGGFTGWLMVEKGVPSYVYVSQDEETVFQGLMYDSKGTPVTLSQVAEAQLRNPELFANANPDEVDDAAQALDENGQASVAATPIPAGEDDRKPSLVMYQALSVANSFKMGAQSDDAPILYAFIDPDCPHCKEFLKSIDKPYLQSQKLQLRVLPIGYMGEESKRRAGWLMAQPNPAQLLMEHANGKTMPAPENATLEGQQLNLDLFTLWQFDGTPVMLYKAIDGRIMMIRGAPNDMDAVYKTIARGQGA